MAKRLFTIITVIVFSTVMFSGVNAQSKPDDKESARIFVQKFYDWYVAFYSSYRPGKIKPVASDIAAINQKRGDFNLHLREALLEDDRAQSSENEIVGLDFDPFLSGQDLATGYQTGNVKQVGNRFLVDVHNIEKGKSKAATLNADVLVIAEVVKMNGHWVFTNFIYAFKDGNANLLTILKNLKKDREKAIK